MINALVIYEHTFEDLFFGAYFKIHEMKENRYSLIVTVDDLDTLEQDISNLGNTLTYIGCFNEDGSKVVFDEPKSYRNFSIEIYNNSLITPTTIENARLTNVGNIAGWQKRDLT